MIPAYKMLAMQIKKRNLQEIEKILKRVYLYGFADGAEAEVNDPDKSDRFVRIKRDTIYEVKCPCRNEVLELDLLDLLERNGE